MERGSCAEQERFLTYQRFVTPQKPKMYSASQKRNQDIPSISDDLKPSVYTKPGDRPALSPSAGRMRARSGTKQVTWLIEKAEAREPRAAKG